MARQTPEERALRDADKAYKARVRQAEQTLAGAKEGSLVSAYGKTRLYEDRLLNKPEELPLAPDNRADVQATGTVTSHDGKRTDSRELYLIVENTNGGMTIKCRPDDGEAVRQLAQKIRLAGPGAAAAAEARQRNIAQATENLERVRGDRADVEAAEGSLTPDAIKRTRRRQRFAWVKWAVGAVVAVLILAAVFAPPEETERVGNDSPSTTTTTATGADRPSTATAPRERERPRPRPRPAPTARAKLDAALRDIDGARVESVSESEVTIYADTPEGGLNGASTGDLNDQAAEIFKAVYDAAGYDRQSVVVFKGGLTDSRTGAALPDVNTGIFTMPREDGAAIDWTNEDLMFVVDFTNFRDFVHPALRRDDD